MHLPDDLVRFVRDHRDLPTLSVYVEASPQDPAARHAWQVKLRKGINDIRHALARADRREREAFERSATALLDRLPQEDAPPSTMGWVCFATANGETVAREIPDVRETSAHWGIGPQIVPYLLVATDTHALVVQADRGHARIGRWEGEQLVALEQFETEQVHGIGPTMGRPAKSGFHSGTRGATGADEEQRIKQDATEKMLAQVRHRIPLLAQPHEPILIGGSTDATTALVDGLPAPVQERTRVVPHLTLATHGGDLAAVIHTTLHLDATQWRRGRVESLRDTARANGKAVEGLKYAQKAAEMGALAELIFSESAWRHQPEVIEQLVHRAMLEGAMVAADPSGAGSILDGINDGVIAGVRFAIPSES
jgi:hypothetical protein